MSNFKIGLFPLKVVVFPGEKLNLHIFEPRYKQLIRDVSDQKSSFGILPLIEEELRSIGALMRLRKIEQVYSDGRMDIKTECIGLYKTLGKVTEAEGQLYKSAIISPMHIDDDGNLVKNIEIIELIRKLYKVLNIKKNLPDKKAMPISYKIGHHIGLNIEQEYALLALPTEEERQNYILDHLQTLLPIAREMEEMRKKIAMNGHFKEFKSPDI